MRYEWRRVPESVPPAPAQRDAKLALRLFERAAVAGLAPAQFRVGNMFEKGIGTQRDLSLARIWYQRAAERGNAKAMHNLAVLHAEGVNGKPDYATATEWFRRAAELGVRDSQFNLAVLLGRGLGAPTDLAKSYLWFSVAADQGDTDAQSALASAYERGQGVVADIDEANKYRVEAGGDDATVDFTQPQMVATSEGCDVTGIPTVSTTDTRVALVIGNSAYEHAAALPNPTCDAQAMAKLKRGG